MLFDEQISRKPDLYPFCQDYIDVMWAGHWTPNEFTFHSDVQNFKVDFTDQERLVVTNALSAIGQIEIAVKKFWSRLGDNMPHPSITDMGLVMANIEVIHNIAYEKLLDSLGLQEVFKENLKKDIIQNRVKYLRKYLDKKYENNKKQYIYAVILFTLFVENVSLFSQFYVVLWFNRFNNVLKDTAQQVQYTKNEETCHAQIGIALVNQARKEYPELFDEDLELRIREEAREAIKAEEKIIKWILGDYVGGENLSIEILNEYNKNRVNTSLQQLGYKSVFDINQDILAKTQWMDEEILGNTKTDFFHKRPVEYSKTKAPDDEPLF
jgi:ribonucleoside-diphosphate reductase beta chain